ncbi:MAG: hypothetical protein JZD40_01090 [Sulfolobus sp.]|nr:hypothetical protein [Sulfolobus sp.]
MMLEISNIVALKVKEYNITVVTPEINAKIMNSVNVKKTSAGESIK